MAGFTLAGLAVAATFNLACSGTMQVTTSLKSEQKPYSSIYRIDLDKNKWCEGQCKALFDLASVQATQITIQNKDIETPTNQEKIFNFINRETGTHSILVISKAYGGTLMMEYTGICEKQPFTGFPNFETKF